MNETTPNIDVNKVVQTIKENLKALREDFDPKELSEESREEISKELAELKEMALEIKRKLNE